MTEALIPWTVTAIYLAGILGVPTLSYAPYALFNLGSIMVLFVLSLLYPYIKWGMPEIKGNESSELLTLICQAIGRNNFAAIDACSTRLRLTVLDPELIDEEAINLLMDKGHRTLVRGENVHILLGPGAQLIAEHLRVLD